MSQRNIKLALVNIKQRDMMSPPLGLGYLATFAQQHMPECDVRIIDINFEDPYHAILDYQPDILGISSITMHYNAALELAAKVKQTLPIPVLLGGVHISSCPESFRPVFDAAVIGEGEFTLRDLLRLYQQEQALPATALAKIPGLIFADGARTVTTATRPLISPIDQIPFPDRSLLNPHYFDALPFPELNDRACRASAIMTSRGCPYKCVFCSTSAFWQKVRIHSAHYVASEVKYLVETFGVEHIKIWDDTIFGKGRLRELRDAFKQVGVLGQVTFNAQLTASLVDDELCDLLTDLGIKGVGFGFESGSDPITEYLKGGAVTVEQSLHAVEVCKQHGLYVMGSLMFGSPGETLADMERTLEFIDAAREKGADQIHIFVTQPFPGTALWRYGQEKGLIKADFDFDHTSKYDVDEPLFLEPSVPKAEFKRILAEAHRRAKRYPAHSFQRRLRLFILHPSATLKSALHRLRNYSALGVRIKRALKALRHRFAPRQTP